MATRSQVGTGSVSGSAEGSWLRHTATFARKEGRVTTRMGDSTREAAGRQATRSENEAILADHGHCGAVCADAVDVDAGAADHEVDVRARLVHAGLEPGLPRIGPRAPAARARCPRRRRCGWSRSRRTACCRRCAGAAHGRVAVDQRHLAQERRLLVDRDVGGDHLAAVSPPSARRSARPRSASRGPSPSCRRRSAASSSGRCPRCDASRASVNTSSVGRFGTISMPPVVRVAPPPHFASGISPTTRSVPGPRNRTASSARPFSVAAAHLEARAVLAPRRHRVGLVEPGGRRDQLPEAVDVGRAEHALGPGRRGRGGDHPVDDSRHDLRDVDRAQVVRLGRGDARPVEVVEQARVRVAGDVEDRDLLRPALDPAQQMVGRAGHLGRPVLDQRPCGSPGRRTRA